MKKIYYMIAMAFMAITFTSCEDVPESYGKPVSPIIPYEPAGTGVETDPFNVAGAIEKCKEIGGKASTEKYYIKGYAAGAAEVDGGKITFTMTDSKEGKGKKFTAYKVAGSDNKSLPSDFAVSIGEEIVLYGPMYYYNSKTPETANGAYIVTVNGEKTGESGGDTPTGEWGTKDNPITVAKALEVINGLADNGTVSPAYVKGKISKVQSYSDQYKSITYYISDDGTDANALQIYSGKGIDGADFAAATDLEKGWTVVVTGELKKYVNKNTGAVTPEINQSSKIVSIDKTTGGGGSDTPSGEAKGSGTLTDPYNVVAIAQEAAKLGNQEVSTQDYYFKGKISSVRFIFDAEKGTANFNVSDDGATSGTQFTCYSVYYLGNNAWVEGNTQIKVGDEVIICGKITNYNGTLETSSKKAYIYSLNGKTEDTGGGDATGLEASFENGKGDFTIDDKSIGEGITYVWYEDKNNKYMKASAYKGGAIAAESWLISPAFSLKGVTAPVLTFNNACNQVKTGTITDHIKVMVYDGTNWTEATIANMPSGTDWTFVDSTVDLTSVAGKEGVKIAFKYVSTTAIAPTWEIKTVSVK
jgi:hypothetical protein